MYIYILPTIAWIISIACGVYLYGKKNAVNKRIRYSLMTCAICAILGIGCRLSVDLFDTEAIVLKGLFSTVSAIFVAEGLFGIYAIKTCTVKVPAIYLRSKRYGFKDYAAMRTLPVFRYEFENRQYESEPIIDEDQRFYVDRLAVGAQRTIFVNKEYPWMYICNRYGFVMSIMKVFGGFIIFAMSIVPFFDKYF